MTIQKLFYLLMLIQCLTACGAGLPMNVAGLHNESLVNLASSSTVDLRNSVAVQNRAIQILSDNCTSCHTATSGPANVFNLTDVTHLTVSALIVPGSPNTSPLLQAIEAGRMPKAGALVAADQLVIRTWILNGAQPPTVAPVLPPTTPPPTGTPAPPTPVSGTLEQKAISILQTNCLSCHGAASNGGLTQITNPDFVKTLKTTTGGLFLVAGNPAASAIWDSIAKGRMPMGSPTLNAADIQVISDWITAGAMAPTAGSVPPPPALPPLSPSFASLNANIFIPKCMGCHSASHASSGVALDSYANVSRNRNKVLSVVQDGSMPQRPNPALTSAEISAIQSWVAAGGLNN